MARTILEIAREAAERDSTAPAPPQLFGTNNKIAKILRTAATDTMREYLRVVVDKGVSEFESTWVFGTVPGRFAYQLPPDYLRMIINTEHRGGSPLGLIGPASPQAWAEWIYGGFAAKADMGWRVMNNALFLDPTPTSYELVTIGYVSRFPVVSPIKAGDYDWTAKPPRANAPFAPRDGYMRMPTEPEVGHDPENAALYDQVPGWDVGVFGPEMSEILKRINPSSGVDPVPMVRRPEFTSDDDRPAFEDDYLLSLGMTFRLQRGLGKDYTEIAAEYEEELERKASDDAGGARPFGIGGGRALPDVIPLAGGRVVVG
jgi:hypothetical protein